MVLGDLDLQGQFQTKWEGVFTVGKGASKYSHVG